MPDRILEEHVHTGGGGGALTTLVVVLILIIAVLAALYFSGVIGRRHETKIDVNINKPGLILRV